MWQPKRCTVLPWALELQHLCKYNMGNTQVQSLTHLTYTVRCGEIVGVLGPGGAVIIDLLSGKVQPDSGEIVVMGRNFSRHERHRRSLFGVVPRVDLNTPGEEFTAWDQLAFHAGLIGLPKSKQRARISAVLRQVHLSFYNHDNVAVGDEMEPDSVTGEAKSGGIVRRPALDHIRVHAFPAGLKKKLALARALLHDPKLLYLDEPTYGLGEQSRRALWDDLLALRDQGKTIVLATTNWEEVSAVCDRVIILPDGYHPILTLERSADQVMWEEMGLNMRRNI